MYRGTARWKTLPRYFKELVLSDLHLLSLVLVSRCSSSKERPNLNLEANRLYSARVIELNGMLQMVQCVCLDQVGSSQIADDCVSNFVSISRSELPWRSTDVHPVAASSPVVGHIVSMSSVVGNVAQDVTSSSARSSRVVPVPHATVRHLVGMSCYGKNPSFAVRTGICRHIQTDRATSISHDQVD